MSSSYFLIRFERVSILFLYMIMEIGNIITGHVNELLGLHKNLKEVRLNICLKCPLYSPRLGGSCNNRLWLDPKTGDVSLTYKEDYVKGCGCRLNAKTTLAKEKCPAGKW